MTIKEIEELAGMPRANIRYYEAEGLLNPTRSENGYRDYSTEDFEILQKIKLLRWATHTCTCWVTTLNHETTNNAVENDSIIEVFAY